MERLFCNPAQLGKKWTVLNFEARGTSGPSYMLMENKWGNGGFVKEFAAANTTSQYQTH
jgi:hypothetical protein